MIRLIPPIAVSVGPAGIAGAMVSGPDDAFRARLLRQIGAPRLSFFPSGRAALSHALAHWKRDGRDTVVVPAYTCWSVAASVVRAGLRVRAVDVDPNTLDYRAGRLENACDDRVVAVVAVQLFARTADTARIAGTARSCGARWIDDAAQAIPEQSSGSDATVLSFGRGKPLALGGGGALLSGSGEAWNGERSAAGGGWVSALRLGLTSLLGSPACYRLPRALPFLRIGATVYDPEFDADAPFYRWQARLGARLQSEWEAVVSRRSGHAARLMQAVNRCEGWTVPCPRAMVGGPLRLPILAPSREVRDRTRARLLTAGVDASAMYPAPVQRIPGIETHLSGCDEPRGAEEIVDRLLTLPTFPTLSESDARRVADAFLESAGGAR
jgi:dTDP-4-amino-4,6-dideoxygalactose transaminase